MIRRDDVEDAALLVTACALMLIAVLSGAGLVLAYGLLVCAGILVAARWWR